MTDPDVEQLSSQLSNILGNFEILQQVNTHGVLPTAQATPMSNIIRDDAVIPDMGKEDVLKNAPQRKDDFFRINPVLE
jgi:aspartyl-tRNA(Asn)/glutamyl-tRNA(Gln) amidotransferase subunit C